MPAEMSSTSPCKADETRHHYVRLQHEAGNMSHEKLYMAEEEGSDAVAVYVNGIPANKPDESKQA